MLFRNTVAKMSGFLVCAHKKNCFLNLLMYQLYFKSILFIYEETFYDTFPWIF